jgi:hypothetical protein
MESPASNIIQSKEDILPAIISEMATNESGKDLLINVLKKNGVAVSDSDTNEFIYTSIYTGIASSKNFRNDLKRAVFSYIKEDEGDESNVNFNAFVPSQSTLQSINKSIEGYKAGKPAYEKAGGGGFFSGLFSKENAQAVSNFAINLLGNKLSEKANKKQVQEGINYQVAKTEALEKERLAQKERAKWIVPTVIISGVVVLSIVGYLVYRNIKAKKSRQ